MAHFDALAADMAAAYGDRKHFLSYLKAETARALADFRASFKAKAAAFRKALRQEAGERAASFQRLSATMREARAEGPASRAGGSPAKRGKKPSEEET